MLSEPNRNIVLVTVDSLRADHCGFVESDSALTPTIDRLADEGIAFTNTVAPGPRTPSSVPVLFTGEFMADDEGWSMADEQRRQRRIARHMTRFTHLSESLQQRGYETVAFTANPWTIRESNFDFGFDHFYEISANSDDISSENLTDSLLFKLADTGLETIPGNPFDWERKRDWFSQWPGQFDLITEQLSELSEPFFAWIFIMDTHQPYITPRRYREECSVWEMYYSILRYWQGEVADEEIPEYARDMIARTYRDAVRSVDAFVDALAAEISRYDAVTVLHSDHGEALGEHGQFGHEQTLYEENLRVPFLIHNAGSSEEITDQLSLRALPEILLDLTDPTTFEPRAHTRPLVISKTEDNRVTSVRTNRWKFVADEAETYLYDLLSDHEESTDVQNDHPDVAAALSDLIRRHEETQLEKGAIGDAAEDVLAGDRVV